MYLYRIKVDNEYLLVKGKRLNQFQPVGGVYRVQQAARTNFNELGVTDDIGFKRDSVNKDDLRRLVPSKNLTKLIKCIDSRKDRELDPIREFHEELTNEEVLSPKNFLHFDYRFIKQHDYGIKWTDYFQCYEILIANIYELLPNEKQLEELRALKEKEIEFLGHTDEDEYGIALTAK